MGATAINQIPLIFGCKTDASVVSESALRSSCESERDSRTRCVLCSIVAVPSWSTSTTIHSRELRCRILVSLREDSWITEVWSTSMATRSFFWNFHRSGSFPFDRDIRKAPKSRATASTWHRLFACLRKCILGFRDGMDGNFGILSTPVLWAQ